MASPAKFVVIYPISFNFSIFSLSINALHKLCSILYGLIISWFFLSNFLIWTYRILLSSYSSTAWTSLNLCLTHIRYIYNKRPITDSCGTPHWTRHLFKYTNILFTIEEISFDKFTVYFFKPHCFYFWYIVVNGQLYRTRDLAYLSHVYASNNLEKYINVGKPWIFLRPSLAKRYRYNPWPQISYYCSLKIRTGNRDPQ